MSFLRGLKLILKSFFITFFFSSLFLSTSFFLPLLRTTESFNLQSKYFVLRFAFFNFLFFVSCFHLFFLNFSRIKSFANRRRSDIFFNLVPSFGRFFPPSKIAFWRIPTNHSRLSFFHVPSTCFFQFPSLSVYRVILFV